MEDTWKASLIAACYNLDLLTHPTSDQLSLSPNTEGERVDPCEGYLQGQSHNSMLLSGSLISSNLWPAQLEPQYWNGREGEPCGGYLQGQSHSSMLPFSSLISSDLRAQLEWGKRSSVGDTCKAMQSCSLLLKYLATKKTPLKNYWIFLLLQSFHYGVIIAIWKILLTIDPS